MCEFSLVRRFRAAARPDWEAISRDSFEEIRRMKSNSIPVNKIRLAGFSWEVAWVSVPWLFSISSRPKLSESLPRKDSPNRNHPEIRK